tara:strand:- start:5341 stop:5577 length:237 start_codon:yes stop_codon:yes gene_type:complete
VLKKTVVAISEFIKPPLIHVLGITMTQKTKTAIATTAANSPNLIGDNHFPIPEAKQLCLPASAPHQQTNRSVIDTIGN